MIFTQEPRTEPETYMNRAWENASNDVVIMAALHALLEAMTNHYNGTPMMTELFKRSSPYPRLPL